jgi:(1->4)-alpha-D-glucan 1-alpha-D-glucosylmutase
VHTAWIDPNDGYDDALSAFVAAVLADQGFVADLQGFLAEHRVVERGRVNSLAQTALLLTCPGIPDLYQGTELWDLSLVDPDNRRPVDYAERRRVLDLVVGAGPEEVLARGDEGAPKLWLIRRVLGHRHRHPAAYGRGSGYEPLHVRGSGARHAVAFARSGGLAVVVPRLVVSPDEAWPGTTVGLPDGDWVDVLTGDKTDGGYVGVATLLRRFPVAILGRQS